MARQQQSSTPLPAPLRTAAAPLLTAASVLRKVPGAGTVGRAAEGMLGRVGAMSPRGRRIAVYTGAGVLGVAGAVEWPVAVTGAAVAWLTQPWRGKPDEENGAAGAPAEGGGTSVTDGLKTAPSSATGGAKTARAVKSPGGAASPGGSKVSGGARTAGRAKTSGGSRASRPTSSSASGTKASTSVSSATSRASGGRTSSAGRGKTAGAASRSRTGGSGTPRRPAAKPATSGTTARRGRTTGT